jgi:DNA-binding CsgD family transcriptional regulator
VRRRRCRHVRAGARVSIHTARTQLKQVMAKTRASRQADLIRLALASPSHLFGRSN